MKYAIRGALLIIVIALTYFVYKSIADPIKYNKEVEVREQAVIDKLKVIRTAQMAYKDQHGEFAKNFDELIEFMEYGKLKIIVEYGDKDDSTTVFRSEELLVNVKDSLFPDIDVQNIRYVPFKDTMQFKMEANKIISNNVTVPVFQVEDPDPFSKERKENNNPLRLGSVYEVNYNGNWGSR